MFGDSLKLKSFAFLLLSSLLLLKLEAQTTVKLATIIPIDSKWDEYLHQMADDWEKITDGQVKITVYSGAIQGEEAEVIRKIRIGQLDAAVLTPLGMNEISSETFIFSIPFLFKNEDEVDYVTSRMGNTFDDIFEKKGFVILGWAQSGWVNLFSKDPIREPSDLRGKKVAWSTGGQKLTPIWKTTGVSLVDVSTSNALLSIQSGLVDTFILPSLLGAQSQVFTMLPYLNTMQISPLVGSFIISRRMWSRIPKEYHKRLLASIEKTKENFYKEFKQLDKEALDIMVNLGNVTVTSPDEQMFERWKSLFVSDTIVGDGKAISPALYQEVQKTLMEYRNR